MEFYTYSGGRSQGRLFVHVNWVNDRLKLEGSLNLCTWDINFYKQKFKEITGNEIVSEIVEESTKGANIYKIQFAGLTQIN